MKRLLLLFFLLIGLSPAHAQVAGMGVNGCGIPLTQLKVGIPAWLQVDTGTGSLCISGTISATTAGFSATQTGIAPLAVSNVTNTASFTSVTSVVVTNVGTTNPMYCQPGAGPATTSAQLITAGGGWFNFYAAGGITQISCITASSTTTANIVGGTGLAAGTGGGAGGGGGGTVTQGNAGTVGQSWFVVPSIGGALVSSGNPLFAQLTAGSAVIGAVTQSGTWIVGQSGAPWSTNIIQVAGSPVVAAATGVQQVGIVGNAAAILDFAGQNASSPANSIQVGCQFNTIPTTLTTGKSSPCQIDSAGNHLVKINAPLPAGTNALGSISNTSFTNPSIGTISSAVPVSGTYIAGLNGTGNLTGISVDSSGNVNMNLINGGVPGYNPGDTSDANGHTIYVQGAPSGNNLPIAIASPIGTGTAPSAAVAVDVVSGSISASTGFNLAVTGTPFTATTGGVTSSSFTPSTEVVVTNTGNANPAYCAPGTGATTSSQYIGPGSWFAFYAVGGISQISCMTSSSTTTINLVAGSGLPTGVTGPIVNTTLLATSANQEVTVAGTTASSAQGVQGVTGGVPLPNSQTDNVGSTGALGALNATVTTTLNGEAGAGLALQAGTLIGTITPQLFDGNQWVNTVFYDPVAMTLGSSFTFGSNNTALTRSILVSGGARQVRVIVTAYTSGTAQATVTGTVASIPATATAIQGAVIGATPPGGSNNVMSITGLSQNGNDTLLVMDPCQAQTHHYSPFFINTATTTNMINGTAGTKIYVCAFIIDNVSAAQNIAMIEGTGATCGTGTTGMLGGTTAGSGDNLAINQGRDHIGSGYAITATATAADNICLITSTTGNTGGVIVWVSQSTTF